MSITYEELLAAMLERVPSNVDKREGSVIYDALAPCAYFLAQQNFQLENYIDLVFPDTAVGSYLDRAVAAYGVSPRKEAACAVRKMETSGAVTLGSRWGIQELVYVVDEKIEEGVYRVICETAGEIGNQYSGAMQPVTNGISGISAELTDLITPGTDEETDEALRARFYTKVQLPATSGNAYHYKKWALEVAGVEDAKIFPLDHGPGTVTILIVGEDKKVNTALENTVAEYIETVRPIGASVTVDSPEKTAVHVSADILPDGSREKDTITEDFKEKLADYLKGLVFTDYRVSFAKVGSILLSIPGVKDYDDLRLNDTTGNIIVTEKAVPVMGTVTLTEVSQLAPD